MSYARHAFARTQRTRQRHRATHVPGHRSRVCSRCRCRVNRLIGTLAKSVVRYRGSMSYARHAFARTQRTRQRHRATPVPGHRSRVCSRCRCRVGCPCRCSCGWTDNSPPRPPGVRVSLALPSRVGQVRERVRRRQDSGCSGSPDRSRSQGTPTREFPSPGGADDEPPTALRTGRRGVGGGVGRDHVGGIAIVAVGPAGALHHGVKSIAVDKCDRLARREPPSVRREVAGAHDEGMLRVFRGQDVVDLADHPNADSPAPPVLALHEMSCPVPVKADVDAVVRARLVILDDAVAVAAERLGD